MKADAIADKLRPEYRLEDFGPMLLGKYAAKIRESSSIVALDPDAAEAFPNAEAVNRALRDLLEVAKRRVQVVSQ